MASLLAQFRLSVDSQECKDLDKYHFFHSSRMLSILRSIALKATGINFYRLYRGRSYISWLDYVKTCRYIEQNQAQLDQWLVYDERIYYYLIRNMSADLGFNIFSPSKLIEEYGLRDKRSVKALLGLNNTLFTYLTDEMNATRSYRFNQCRGHCNNSISKAMSNAVMKFIEEIGKYDYEKSFDLVG